MALLLSQFSLPRCLRLIIVFVLGTGTLYAILSSCRRRLELEDCARMMQPSIKSRTVAIRLCMHFIHALLRRDRYQTPNLKSDTHSLCTSAASKGVIQDNIQIRLAGCNSRRTKPRWHRKLTPQSQHSAFADEKYSKTRSRKTC